VEQFRDLLVSHYRMTATEFESDKAAVCVLIVFDHDWEQHLLVQQWDHTAPDRERRWVYALWYIPSGDAPVLVRTYPDVPHGDIPYMSAASIVDCWRDHGHYGGAAGLDPAMFA
jgi:hypothetical protein